MGCNNRVLNVLCEHKNFIQLSSDSLRFLGRGGFRYVTVDSKEWWVNRLVVNDSTVEINHKEQNIQRDGGDWSKLCAWLKVERKGDSLTISVDAKKKMKHEEESFKVEIQNTDTTVVLQGTVGDVITGADEDITPSMRNVVFNRGGGKVRIALKGGEVSLVTVDGKNPPVRPRKLGDLNEYTCDWLTVYCVPGKMLELEAAKNLSGKIRSFSLSLVNFDSHTHIKGIQQASVDISPTDTIGFAPSKVRFPLEGGTVEVVARTDGWILDKKSYGLDWLTIEQDSNRLKLTATPNFDYDIRHFTLRFKKRNYYEYLEGEQETR